MLEIGGVCGLVAEDCFDLVLMSVDIGRSLPGSDVLGTMFVVGCCRALHGGGGQRSKRW